MSRRMVHISVSDLVDGKRYERTIAIQITEHKAILFQNYRPLIEAYNKASTLVFNAIDANKENKNESK